MKTKVIAADPPQPLNFVNQESCSSESILRKHVKPNFLSRPGSQVNKEELKVSVRNRTFLGRESQGHVRERSGLSVAFRILRSGESTGPDQA